MFETYHFTQSLALFNQRLSQDLLDTDDRDALWLTATFLGMLTFASVHSSAHKETWPSNHTDPEWLHIAKGKKAV
ncbi:uncharacterized protein CDV56_103428 [Aspergillus thermomutatus]|uniref:Transcription factor domain-containing protein n=1 Tax=Aspergillus thermomutatus TaxID=41047 RepID=A0A397GBI3_ASPTH|nr:uncharacterized protein CDV56_103428 [Aspergillus thermomutatus]RHZ48372.1 hypothetical protein CDV56_103428 [Aspergillus thermomutatus]